MEESKPRRNREQKEEVIAPSGDLFNLHNGGQEQIIQPMGGPTSQEDTPREEENEAHISLDRKKEEEFVIEPSFPSRIDMDDYTERPVTISLPACWLAWFEIQKSASQTTFLPLDVWNVSSRASRVQALAQTFWMQQSTDPVLLGDTFRKMIRSSPTTHGSRSGSKLQMDAQVDLMVDPKMRLRGKSIRLAD